MYRIAILFIFFLSFIFPVNAGIYQYIDSDGNITYSDKEIKGGKKLRESTSSSTQAPRKITSSPFSAINGSQKTSSSALKQSPGQETNQGSEKPKAKRYRSITIVSPKNDQGVRGNNGDLEVTVRLKPKLQTAFGHKIQLLLDGKKMQGDWQSNVILLKEIDRGTHTLSARVTDKSGKKLKLSKVITFHLLRHSILMSR